MNKLALLCAGAMLAAGASADVLNLKGGDRVTGTLASIEADGTVVFKAKLFGQIKVKAADVEKLATDADSVIEYKASDRENEKGRISIDKPGEITFTPSGAAARKLDMAEVNAVNPGESAWHGAVNVSLAAARGNTESSSGAIDANVNRRWKHDRLTGNASYNQSRTRTQRGPMTKSSDRTLAFAQHDHFWLTKVYSYENVKYERDRLQNLEWRYRAGLGLGIQWLEGRKFDYIGKISFNQELGVTFTGERYRLTAHPENKYAAVRYAHHFGWEPLWVENLSFFHNFEYIVDTADFRNYQIVTDVGAKYAFSKQWQLLGKIEWLYNSDPADGLCRGDTRYFLGVGYTF